MVKQSIQTEEKLTFLHQRQNKLLEKLGINVNNHTDCWMQLWDLKKSHIDVFLLAHMIYVVFFTLQQHRLSAMLIILGTWHWHATDMTIHDFCKDIRYKTFPIRLSYWKMLKIINMCPTRIFLIKITLTKYILNDIENKNWIDAVSFSSMVSKHVDSNKKDDIIGS